MIFGALMILAAPLMLLFAIVRAFGDIATKANSSPSLVMGGVGETSIVLGSLVTSVGVVLILGGAVLRRRARRNIRS